MRARAQGRGDGNRRVLAHHGRTSCPRGRYLSHRRCPRKVCRPWRNGLAPATAHDDDAFPHPARYGQRGGNTFMVGGARSTPAQCDRQRCPRGPSAASSAPCRLGGALRRGGAAGALRGRGSHRVGRARQRGARSRRAPPQRDAAPSGAWGQRPGTAHEGSPARRPRRSSRGRCGARCREGGGSSAPGGARRHPAPLVCHPPPHQRHTSRCRLPSVSPPGATRLPASAPLHG